MDTTSTTTEFVRFHHHPETIPQELKAGERWVCCDEYKVPLIPIPSGAVFAASSTNPETWRSYEVARRTYEENEHVTGVGRVITTDEPFVGIDLDDSIDVGSGELKPWATRIVERLDSYAELSPSLTGLKIWVRAPEITRSYSKPRLEIYAGRRYFTVTGDVLGGSRYTVETRTDELKELISEEFPRVERAREQYDGCAVRVVNLLELLEKSGVEVFADLRDDTASIKFNVLCPWAYEHSDCDVSGTYCGQYENGAVWFKCWHSHCSGRRWPEFRSHLESIIYLGRQPRSNGGGRLR